MFYSVISSGKSGNCVIINDVMVDCGVPFAAIKPYLDGIRYLIITHIHSDHVDRLTLENIKELRPDIIVIGNSSVNEQFGVHKVSSNGFVNKVEHYVFQAFELTHDVQNTGYTWQYNDKGVRKDIIYATDTGDLNNAPAQKYDYFFLESCYDAEKVRELNERASSAGRQLFTKFSRHLSHQEAELFFKMYKKDEQARLIKLHKSESIYAG